MADILAEEDDDEGFGDFKFAPTVPAPAAQHSSFQSDDYWSGFVGLNGAGISQSRSSPSIAANYVENFRFYTDHASTQPSVPSLSEPVKPNWLKPSGAIPLSIFGEDENEEPVSNGKSGEFQHSNGDPVKKDSVPKKSVGLDDLIANMLNQNRRIISSNVPNANLTTAVENVQKEDPEIGSGIGLNLDSSSNGWASSAAEGKEELDDEDEWQFMAADEEAKEEQNKAGIASDFNFSIGTASWNGLNSDQPGSTSSFNGLKSANNGFGSVREEMGFKVDDFDWEFRGSEVQSHLKDGNPKVHGRTKDLFIKVEVSSAAGNGVHEQNDLYVASDGISQKYGALDFEFDLNPNTGSQGSVISDSRPTSSANAVKYDWNSNPTNRSFTSDENSLEFKDAVSEIGPSSQEDPKDANGIFSKPAHEMASVDPWAFQDTFSDSDSKQKGNEGHQYAEKKPLPLSLFGETQLEMDNSLVLPDVASTKSAAAASSGAKRTSSMSIRDLLSLYNQAAENAAGTEMQKSSETDLHISKMMPEEESADGVDNSDDSWHFKGSSPEQRDENQGFAKQLSENELDLKPTLPEPIVVNGADILDDDSWDFKDASLENGDEIEGSKKLGDKPTLPEPIIVNDADTLNDDSWDFKGTSLEKGHDIESFKQLGDVPTFPEPLIVNGADILDDDLWDFEGTSLERGDDIESSKQLGDVPTFPEPLMVNGAGILDDDSWDFKGAGLENADKVGSSKQLSGEGLVFNCTLPESGMASSSNLFDEDSWNFKGVSTEKGGDNLALQNQPESGMMNIDIFDDDSWNFKGADAGKGDGNPGEVGDTGLGFIQTLPESRTSNSDGVLDDDSWSFKGVSPEKGDGNPVGEIGEKGLVLNQNLPESGMKNSDGFFDDDSWSFKGISPEKGDGSLDGFGLNVNGDHNPHDDSWEIKDAISTISTGDINSRPDHMESGQTLNVRIEADDLIDFYSKLKDELCVIAASHLDKIKEAHWPDDLRIEEIQGILNKIQPPSLNPNVTSNAHSTRTTNLNGLLEIIQEKFQVLEDEYQLSDRLKSAEDDPESLHELLRHVASTLKILRSGSIEEQSSYVSTWMKLISACRKELEHGASIWKQALAKNVNGQLLSTSEGRKYFLSLGEIYRAVGVLGASTKLYKAWILLLSADSSAISALLLDCSKLWLDSGLEQALRGISDPLGFEGTIEALLESNRRVHSLETNILQNHFFAYEEEEEEEPICQLSLLAAATVPDMKMVEWDGKHYFLKLANLWANLVSSDPPSLDYLFCSSSTSTDRAITAR